MCAKEYDRLEATEVRADDDAVYIDLVHRAVIPEQTHPVGNVGVVMLVNSCPAAKQPRISGALWRDFASPSTATIPLSELPDGDLDLSLRAFGQEYGLLLQKQGRSIRRIGDAERSNAHFAPAEPAFGLPPAVIFEVRDCAEEGVR